MCIAIYEPVGKSLSKSVLHTCWQNNSDGAGFMYARDNSLIIQKGFFKFKTFFKSYKSIHPKNYPVVLHFRIATHGQIDKENCHPHSVNENLAFVHNGIIATDNPTEALLSDQSDTMLFNEAVLKKLDIEYGKNNWLKSKVIMELIAGYIDGSKLIFMDNLGNIKIVNENLGEWNDGCWFSNSTYQTRFSHAIASYPYSGYGSSGIVNGYYWNEEEGRYTNKKTEIEKPDNEDYYSYCCYCGKRLDGPEDDYEEKLCYKCLERFGEIEKDAEDEDNEEDEK